MKSDKPSWDQESEIISFCNLIKKIKKTRAPEKSHLKNVHRPFRKKKNNEWGFCNKRNMKRKNRGSCTRIAEEQLGDEEMDQD